MNNIYELYTDGSCLNNPGPGGWAYLLQGPNIKMKIESGFQENTTNNQMELTAILKGLQYFFECVYSEGCVLKIMSDSIYAINGIKSWMLNWARQNWKNKQGKTICNVELWKKIYILVINMYVECHHIRGHQGNKENELCDILSRKEAKKLKKNGNDAKKRLL